MQNVKRNAKNRKLKTKAKEYEVLLCYNLSLKILSYQFKYTFNEDKSSFKMNL